MKNTYLLLLSLFVATATQAQQVLTSPVGDETELMCENMSPNGKFQVGTNYAGFCPTLWNVFSNEVISYPQYEEGAFHAVNDEGVAVGDDGTYAILRHADGTIEPLYYDEGETKEVTWEDGTTGTITTGDAGSGAYAISADGRTIAGYYFKSDYTTFPCIWQGGKRIDLPLPTAEEIGYGMMGGEARWMTPDAKVIAGFIFDDMSTWPAIIWRQQADGTYKYDVVSRDYYEANYQEGKPYMLFTPGGISANGEWMSLSIQPEFDVWDFSVPAPDYQAARLNLRTMELQVCQNDGDRFYTPYGIANDGSCVMVSYPVGQEQGMIGRNGHVWTSTDEVVTIAGLAPQDETLDELSANCLVPGAISADGSIVQGFGINMGSSILSFAVFVNGLPEGIRNIDLDANLDLNLNRYDLQGRMQMRQPQRGLYIQGGRKVYGRN